MEINIRVFDSLDAIAKSHRITDIEWAELAKIRRPTIPELRRISRETKSGVGKARFRKICTLDKIVKLYAGLSLKLGNAELSKHLKKSIENEPNAVLRLHFLVLLLQQSDKEKRDRAEIMLRTLIEET